VLTENPFRPPGSDLGSEPGSLAGRGDFDIGRCLSDAWANTWSNFPLWLGAGLVGLVLGIAASLTVIGVFLVVPVLSWGATRFALRMHDGGAKFGDLFSGFSIYTTALVGILVCLLVLLLVGIAGQSVQLAGDFTDNSALSLIGVPINLAVSFLVSPRLTFSYFYVVDRGLPPVEALRRAWEDTGPVMWKLAVMVLLGFVILAAGTLLLLVGILPAAAIVTLMWVSAYRQLVGRAA
jgi:hypothetical protein